MSTHRDSFVESERLLFARHDLAPRTHFISVGANRVRVLEFGTGEPVVLVHGGGAFGSVWSPLVGELRGRRVLVLDRPGCGLSDPFDYRGVDVRAHAVAVLDAVWNAFSLSRADLVGNCAGGLFTLAFTLARTERVRRLALIGAPAGTDRWLPMPSRLLGTRGLNVVLARTAFRPSSAGTRELYRRLFAGDITHVGAELLACAYHGQMLEGAERSFLTLMERITSARGLAPEYYLAEELTKLPTKTLFVAGDRSYFDPKIAVRDLAQRMPDARCEVVEGAGHFAWLDAPTRCAALLDAFLATEARAHGLA
jgi:pimeloyl-ACP methyl ester carboxylesterase